MKFKWPLRCKIYIVIVYLIKIIQFQIYCCNIFFAVYTLKEIKKIVCSPPMLQIAGANPGQVKPKTMECVVNAKTPP